MNVHLSSVQMSKKAIIISHPKDIYKFSNYRSCINNPELWHKVVISTNGTVQKSVLGIIMNYVHPFDFIPVCFCIENRNASFFIRNCSKAINRLCQELVVPNPKNRNKPFTLSIILGYCNTSNSVVKVEDNILLVLTKRYSASTKYLNLDKFHEDPDLTEFCALSQPQILNYILFLCRKFEVHNLSLRSNRIYSLSRVEEFSNMKLTKVLDLRNNLIEDISEIKIFGDLNISSLFLENNPLCRSYDEQEYIIAVKEEIPFLQSLDGKKTTSWLAAQRNFLCNMEAFELIDQFLSHYFSLYDSRIRDILVAVYDENATFSFSSGFTSLLTFNDPTFHDLRRAERCVITGSDNIINVLNSYPRCRHDPFTFTVDVIYYSDETTILTVTGRLKQLASIALGADGILHFSRTFVLNKRLYNEYKIVNDMWLVNAPTYEEVYQQFDVPRYVTGQEVKFLKLIKLPSLTAFNENDKNSMVSTFAKITTVDLDSSRRFLEKYKFNLVKTLKYFSDAYEKNTLPSDFFIQDAEIADGNNVSTTTSTPTNEEQPPTITPKRKKKANKQKISNIWSTSNYNNIILTNLDTS